MDGGEVSPRADGMADGTIPHVIVVGGGIGGLVVARELAGSGIRVTLFEASARLGGKVHRHTVGGIELDAAAESFATRGGTVAELATELGLGGAIVTPTPRGAWLMQRSGVAVPLPKAGLLGIPSVPLARDVIAVVGLAGALRAQLDSVMLGFVGTKSRDLATLVRRRMGRAVLDRLVSPVATAIHSKDPSELLLDVVAPKLRNAVLSSGSLAAAVLTLRGSAPAGSAVQGIDGGVVRLVDALVADLDGRVDLVLDARVSDADASGVTLADGSRRSADHVVVATELGAPTGKPITLATLVLRASALDASPRGSGVIVASGAPTVRAKALTHATAKWDWLAREAAGAHVLRLSYERAPESDDELREWARTDAELLLGVALPPSTVLDFDRQAWTGPGDPAEPIDRPAEGGDRGEAVDGRDASGPTIVGERVSGAGLAGVIRSAKLGAVTVRTHLAGTIGLRLSDL